ncbi:MAG: hypothetical protein WC632_05050 [Candidatus Margulisiibacteriota bacterium]
MTGKKVLLDTNIIIHREATTPVDPDIGILFKWLDDLHFVKCAHPLSVEEIEKHRDPKTVKAFLIKLGSYTVLRTKAPIHPLIESLCFPLDKNENDTNDSLLLNELMNKRVDLLISEDGGVHDKAIRLGLASSVFTIDGFLARVRAENPSLINYKVLSVRKEHFGNLNIRDEFFDSLRQDYPGFDDWFNRKSEDDAYVCMQDEKILAFLYIKIENKGEKYPDIEPAFASKKRLKIGTFKVAANGFNLGERFLKIVFDHALLFKAEEIYVTICDERIERLRLKELLRKFGFNHYGYKKSSSCRDVEEVCVRDFTPKFNPTAPKITFPYISADNNIFITPIYPEYHTTLLPDSILRTELPEDYEGDKPFRNAISKVYISRSIERNIRRGDLIVFYRTGGYFKSVITTIGIIEGVKDNIENEERFIELCGKRSVFTREELSGWWNYNPGRRPFVVYFLCAYSFPRRLNLKELIDLKIIKDIDSAPRGFARISKDQLNLILKETKTNESIIIH